MTTIFLLLLFITQLIGFYFIAFLYMKVAKFDELEKKQRKLMDEMDDSIGAYLSELKDENDRLIAELAARDKGQSGAPARSVEEIADQRQEKKAVTNPKVPVSLALQSYRAASLSSAEQEAPRTDEMNGRERAFQLYDRGHSVEEIAKMLGIGRTEVELLLKFR